MKTGLGVDGIGRRFSIKYSLVSGRVMSYTLDEGEIEGGELNGFGRMVNCYGQSHEIITGFFENGELFETRPF